MARGLWKRTIADPPGEVTMMATITELRPLKRRVLIMVDGRRFACVPRVWVDELQLEQFDEVDADELGQAIAARQFEGAYAYALDLLAASMRTRKQVLTKLAERGCCALTLEMVGQRLAESGLLDDAAYAARRAELMSARGKGRRAALNDLIQKGVDAETARRSIENWDVGAERHAAEEVALSFMRKRWGDDRRRARMLTYAALSRRGYPGDVARAAVDKAARALAAEEEDE